MMRTTPSSPRSREKSSARHIMLHTYTGCWLLFVGTCFLFLEGRQPLVAQHLAMSSSLSYAPEMTTSGSRLLVKSHYHHQHRHHQRHSRAHHVEDEITNGSQLDFLGRKKPFRQQQQHEQRSHSKASEVPEQLPVVVSSSDNSYVSASPVFIDPPAPAPAIALSSQQTTTTTLVVDNDHHQRASHQHPSSSRRHTFTNRISDDDDEEKEEEDYSSTRDRSWQRDPLLWTSSTSSQLDNNNNKSNSTSDISTTATTTQRNNGQQTESLSNEAKPPTSKPGSLISRFEIKLATIINTQESIDAGATFINYTVVTNFDACLVECWITDSCDTAVYQESNIAHGRRSGRGGSSYNSEQQHRHLHLKRRNGHNNMNDITFGLDSLGSSDFHVCFLFECVKFHEFRCQFSAHDNYVSSILMKKINFAREDEEEEEEEDNSSSSDVRSISDKMSNDIDIKAQMTISDCNQSTKFRCLLPNTESGCIEMSQRCDGVVDCSNGSDESDCAIITGQKVSRSVSGDDGDDDDEDGEETSTNQINEYNLVDQTGKSSKLRPVIAKPRAEVHYSRIINSHPHQRNHPINGHGHWHDTRIASIRIGEYEDYGKGGLNSALIAILFGVAITAMLIMIVGHKMRSIRRRLAYKSRRRSLVPDKELFINTPTTTLPI